MSRDDPSQVFEYPGPPFDAQQPKTSNDKPSGLLQPTQEIIDPEKAPLIESLSSANVTVSTDGAAREVNTDNSTSLSTPKINDRTLAWPVPLLRARSFGTANSIRSVSTPTLKLSSFQTPTRATTRFGNRITTASKASQTIPLTPSKTLAGTDSGPKEEGTSSSPQTPFAVKDPGDESMAPTKSNPSTPDALHPRMQVPGVPNIALAEDRPKVVKSPQASKEGGDVPSKAKASLPQESIIHSVPSVDSETQHENAGNPPKVSQTDPKPMTTGAAPDSSEDSKDHDGVPSGFTSFPPLVICTPWGIYQGIPLPAGHTPYGTFPAVQFTNAQNWQTQSNPNISFVAPPSIPGMSAVPPSKTPAPTADDSHTDQALRSRQTRRAGGHRPRAAVQQQQPKATSDQEKKQSVSSEDGESPPKQRKEQRTPSNSDSSGVGMGILSGETLPKESEKGDVKGSIARESPWTSNRAPWWTESVRERSLVSVTLQARPADSDLRKGPLYLRPAEARQFIRDKKSFLLAFQIGISSAAHVKIQILDDPFANDIYAVFNPLPSDFDDQDVSKSSHPGTLQWMLNGVELYVQHADAVSLLEPMMLKMYYTVDYRQRWSLAIFHDNVHVADMDWNGSVHQSSPERLEPDPGISLELMKAHIPVSIELSDLVIQEIGSRMVVA